MQMIIVQDPVVYPFAGCPVVINLFIFFCAACNRRIKTDIPGWFCINAASIRGRRAGVFTGTAAFFATGNRTAPFAAAASGTEAPVDHPVTGLTERSAIRIDGNGIRYGCRPAALGVQVDKRTDLPGFAQMIGGIIVMCRVQAEIPDKDIGIQIPEFLEGNDGADAVMPAGIQDMKMQGKIDFPLFIMEGKQIKRMPEIISFEIAVPSPPGIRVRIMARTGTVLQPVFQAVTDFVSMRIGMGMDAGSVAGECNPVSGDQTGTHGREQGSQAEKFLKELFVVKREFFPGESLLSHNLCNAGMPVWKFVAISRLFPGLFVPVCRESIISAEFFKLGILEPEAVHEVIIRPQGWKGTGSAADQESQEIIGSKAVDPGG